MRKQRSEVAIAKVFCIRFLEITVAYGNEFVLLLVVIRISA